LYSCTIVRVMTLFYGLRFLARQENAEMQKRRAGSEVR
jgi:hypothetical protein